MYCSEVTSKLFCIYLVYKNSQIFNLQLSSVSRVSHFEDFKQTLKLLTILWDKQITALTFLVTYFVN